MGLHGDAQGGGLSSWCTACVTLVLQAGIEPTSPALEGRFLTTRSLGSSPSGHVSLGSCWLWPCFRTPLSDSPCQFSGVPDNVLSEYHPVEICVIFFSQLDSGYRSWRGNKVKIKSADIKCLFSSRHMSVIPTWLSTVATALGHPAEVAFVILFSWKEDSYVQFYPSSFRVMCLHYLFIWLSSLSYNVWDLSYGNRTSL